MVELSIPKKPRQNCIVCGAINTKHTSKFCSRECFHLHRKTGHTCILCNQRKPKDHFPKRHIPKCGECLRNNSKPCLTCGGPVDHPDRIYCSHPCFCKRSDTTKTCRKCGTTKAAAEFEDKKRTCRLCASASRKVQYHSDIVKATRRNRRSRVVQKSTNWKTLLKRVSKGTAKKYGMQHDLTEEWLEEQFVRQGGRCYYTGCTLVFGASKRYPLQPSLDRVDPAKGYTQDNVVIAALWVNFAKNDSSVNDFFFALAAIDYEKALCTKHGVAA